jgi:hypothetical protein
MNTPLSLWKNKEQNKEQASAHTRGIEQWGSKCVGSTFRIQGIAGRDMYVTSKVFTEGNSNITVCISSLLR